MKRIFGILSVASLLLMGCETKPPVENANTINVEKGVAPEIWSPEESNAGTPQEQPKPETNPVDEEMPPMQEEMTAEEPKKEETKKEITMEEPKREAPKEKREASAATPQKSVSSSTEGEE